MVADSASSELQKERKIKGKERWIKLKRQKSW